MEKSAILAVDIKKLDMEAFARVAQWAVLDEIYLADAKISRAPLIAAPEEISLEHKCDTNILFSEKGKPIIEKILCNFQVAAFSSDAPDKLLMKIEASFCTSYIFKVYQPPATPDDFGVGPDDLEYLFTINPIINAWPYWREFVHGMSARMGFPALTVPLLEIVPKKSGGKETKSQPIKRKSIRQKKVNA